MKNTILKSFISLLFIALSPSIYAQTFESELEERWPNLSNSCLGIHCYVSVDLNTDPVENGYLKYTIPVPRETIDFISGPVGCYLGNHLGNTIDIYVRRIHLELLASDQPQAQVPFELFVRLWKDHQGVTTTTPSSDDKQCYYLKRQLLAD